MRKEHIEIVGDLTLVAALSCSERGALRDISDAALFRVRFISLCSQTHLLLAKMLPAHRSS